MAKPNSRSTLIDYSLRALGHPVIEINVDDEQLDDRCDEALQFYQHYHQDAIEKVFLKHKVTGSKLNLSASVGLNFLEGETITGTTSGATAVVHKDTDANYIVYTVLTHDDEIPFQSEVITGKDSNTTATISSITIGDMENQYIPVPELVTDVIRLMPIRENFGTNNLFDIKYQMHLNDMFSLGYLGSLLEYSMAQQYLSTLDVVIDSDDKFTSFDRHKDQLRIDMAWQDEVEVGDYLVVEAYRIIDPDTFTDVYNDYYLKKYLTALVKKQWGMNLLKFEGMQMPGGVQFNGRQLFDDATQELERLEEEVRLNWEQPVDFYIG
jgi:hypothetical protein